MGQTRRKRPVAVLVGGYLALGESLLMISMGTVPAVAWFGIGGHGLVPLSFTDGARLPGPWLYVLGSGALLLFGAGLLVCSLGFLALKPWGRWGLKVLGWILLPIPAVGTVWYLWDWVQAAAVSGSWPILAVIVFFGVAHVLGWFVPTAAFLACLEHEEVRRAFRPGSRPA